MQELRWLESHLGSIQKAVELANEMYWKISVKHGKDHYSVIAGDQVIFRADTQEAVDAFLYGIGLAYCVIPKSVFQEARDSLKPWVE
jgi:hypothetical protein